MKDIVNLTNIYSCFDFADATHNVDMCSSKNLSLQQIIWGCCRLPRSRDEHWTGLGLDWIRTI